MRFGKGLRRDAADHPWRAKQRDARHLLYASPLARTRAPGTIVSLRSFEKHTYSQLDCEGCTGHSIAFGVETATNAAGTPLDFAPSPGDPYKIGRCIGRGSPGIPLADDGAQLADVAQAISQWGMRPIGPLNPAGYTDVTTGPGGNVNVEPFFGDLEADSCALVVGEDRVDLGSLTLIDDVCSLLDVRVPIWTGGPVGPKYEGYVAGGAPVGAEPDGDGHATVITGYWVLTAEHAAFFNAAAGAELYAAGDVLFEDKTSWGAFGDAGHVWVTADHVKALWDAYALRVRMVTS